MKYLVTRFKSLAVTLKELEPFIRNGHHLTSGKPFVKFDGMRSREMLANWLLCVAVNWADGRNLSFSNDPTGGDGIIFDLTTGDEYPTEHVMIPRHFGARGETAETLILKQVEKKRNKGGAQYAAGKTLVVFLDAGAGSWHANKVASQLPCHLLFAAVWVVNLQCVKDGEYVYNVVHLDLSDGDCPVTRVRIAKDFENWTLTWVQ
jgi:hypothetical protein